MFYQVGIISFGNQVLVCILSEGLIWEGFVLGLCMGKKKRGFGGRCILKAIAEKKEAKAN